MHKKSLASLHRADPYMRKSKNAEMLSSFFPLLACLIDRNGPGRVAGWASHGFAGTNSAGIYVVSSKETKVRKVRSDVSTPMRQMDMYLHIVFVVYCTEPTLMDGPADVCGFPDGCYIRSTPYSYLGNSSTYREPLRRSTQEYGVLFSIFLHGTTAAPKLRSSGKDTRVTIINPDFSPAAWECLLSLNGMKDKARSMFASLKSKAKISRNQPPRTALFIVPLLFPSGVGVRERN